jgi:hypothetical protein
MFIKICNFICNLFSDCVRYKNEPSYQKIIQDQEDIYYNHDAFTSDPLWQDRRLLSFIYTKPNETKNK